MIFITFVPFILILLNNINVLICLYENIFNENLFQN